MSDYPTFGKIPRLYKPVVVTEKIDGTNGLIEVTECPDPAPFWSVAGEVYVNDGGQRYRVRAGSRNRWLSIEDDNKGFAFWVDVHAEELVRGLGPGRHYGEWWGSGVKRDYGFTHGEKRFSLFNVTRWGDSAKRPACCEVVPVVATGGGYELSSLVDEALTELSIVGSYAAPGYDRPEGVVIWHSAADALFKVTLEGDLKTPAVNAKAAPYIGRHVSDVPPWTWRGWWPLNMETVQFIDDPVRQPAMAG